MGNCCKKSKEPPRTLTLAILGLDNAGKTVTAKGLLGEPIDIITPTIGFTSMDFKHDKHSIVMFDLGGGKRIRDIWHNYLGEIYGLIFVVDASDTQRVQECKTVLQELIEHRSVAGKPVLLLANKQDKPGAMDDIDIVQALGLEELVNVNKCPCRVETCAASVRQGKKMDPSITTSFSWLIDTILKDFDRLNERVKKDMEEKQIREEREKEARKERVRKIREEREHREGKPEDEVDHGDQGDPFKRVNVAELEEKERRLKQEKEAQKRRGKEAEPSDESPYRSSRYRAPAPNTIDDRFMQTSRSLDGTTNSGIERILRHGKEPHNENGLTSLSLQQARELDRRKLRSGNVMKDDESPESGNGSLAELRSGARSRLGHENKDDVTSPGLLPWQRDPRAIDTAALGLSPRVGLVPAGSMNQRRGLMPLAPLAPLDSGTLDRKKKKKKNRAARHNQTEPMTDDELQSGGGNSDDPFSVRGTLPPRSRSPPGLKSSHGYSPPPQRNLLKQHNPHKPKLEPLSEPESDKDSFSKKWGLVDELPTMEGRRSRPNEEYDSDILM